MISKLAAGNSGYDVVEPSQYAVQLLVGQDLVEPIDYDQVEGLDNVQAKFIDPSFDPGNEYSLPWIWGTTGPPLQRRVHRAKRSRAGMRSSTPPSRARSTCSTTCSPPYIVGPAVDRLERRHRPTKPRSPRRPRSSSSRSRCSPVTTRPTTSTSSPPATPASSLAWGGSARSQASWLRIPTCSTCSPRRAARLWVDSFSIAKGAPHSDAAYKFLNFVLQPEIAAMATNDGSARDTNEAALELITDTALLEQPRRSSHPTSRSRTPTSSSTPAEAMQLLPGRLDPR